MKKYLFLGLFFVLLSSVSAQNITGTWHGMLKTHSIELRIVFHIEKSENGFSATLDSPDQGAKGLACNAVSFENPNLKIDMKNLGAVYEAVLRNDTLYGNFTQMGVKLPLDLTRHEVKKAALPRPQEPKPPFPYYSEEVTFVNKADGVTLAGTLTLPKKEGKFPVVILISGSGPQNRDEELMGHKPFLVIADYLTRGGIGVLRFDDRGTAQSSGDFKTATTFDFSKDVEAAFNFLLTRNDVDKKKIGLIGHSEGGVIAPMVAARNNNVVFIVLLAGTGVRGDKLLLMQTEAIGKASGMSEADLEKTMKINAGAYDLVLKSENTEKLKSELKAYFTETMSGALAVIPPEQKEAQLHAMTEQLASPWMQYFIRYNPIPALEKVKCPVLALNGSKDTQVPPKENLSAIKKALETGGNKNFKTVEQQGLNHLFQECESGSPAEYARIEQTFSPKALEEIWKWIKGILKQ